MKTSTASLTQMTQMPVAPMPVRVARLIWEHMMLFIFASLLLYLAVLPAIAVWLLGAPLLALWMAVLTLGPSWLGIVVGTRMLLAGEEVSWRMLLRLIRQNWLIGVRISALPALMISIFMATYTLLVSYPRESWLYLPLFFDGAVTTLVVLAGLTAFSLPSHNLRGWAFWKVSLAVTRLQLAKQLVILALFAVLEIFVTVVFNAVSLLPLLCVPLVICLELLTQQTCASLVGSKEKA